MKCPMKYKKVKNREGEAEGGPQKSSRMGESIDSFLESELVSGFRLSGRTDHCYWTIRAVHFPVHFISSNIVGYASCNLLAQQQQIMTLHFITPLYDSAPHSMRSEAGTVMFSDMLLYLYTHCI